MRHPTVSTEPLTPRVPELSDLASRYSQGWYAPLKMDEAD